MGETARLMPTTAERYQTVEITWRKDFSPDLWSIRVRPDQKLLFKPGQYATLGVRQGEHVVERPYSIVSSPLEDEIEFFFELVPQGGLTPLLYGLQPGDRMLMRRQAKGLFTLVVKSGHKRHYLVSTVTGVAPYVSIARTLSRESRTAKPSESELLILQAASRSWEFAYREELASLAQEHEWIRYVATVSRPWEDPGWNGEVGRAEDVLRKYLDSFGFQPSDSTVYLCGHPDMIRNAQGILVRRGFLKEFIREEIYWVPKKGNSEPDA
jgi:ferredoxin/flavodoxin---NADP+ reductase